ncbi:tRNA pseudouridine(55) synthase TruB [Bowdeniella nasicola]|uniref:tRNA pseudouridine synthase B n=1 Tax=Bowdeniella nasicola TaxID=208480 RepID=A0A1Q5Q5S1_9ACTO|nr:tRNA pseudouridine(55) synthase TruB [Bowdeniella nasicola]OKL55156.1 tRNA pseudouridine(55) synthase TruB [Bowdeniella nasicola]
MSNGPSGFVLVNKPAGPTSHGVVAALRRSLATRKVGHAGTLDPMATGLLIAGVGRATRLLTYLVGLDKAYTATIRLGEATTTDDAEGELMAATDAFRVTDAQILAALQAFRGEIMQRPTRVSAIKVDGKRAYDRVRAGEDVEIAARPVTIHELEVLSGPTPATGAGGGGVVDLDVRVRVSSGTYIRAIARDLGEALGVGGHLTRLERTSVGPFTLADASELEAPELLEPLGVMGRVLPVCEVDDGEAKDLAQGRFIAPRDFAGEFALAAHAGSLIAVVTVREGRTRPVLVMEAQ